MPVVKKIANSSAHPQLRGDRVSLLFQRARCLSYDERVEDGFRVQFPGELLLVDARQDPALLAFLRFARGCLPSREGAAHDPLAAVSAAARAVAAALGGRAPPRLGSGRTALEARFQGRLQHAYDEGGGPHADLPLGRLFGRGGAAAGGQELGAGLQRHRAVLFKYLCDALAICNCALLDTAAEVASEDYDAGFLNVVWANDEIVTVDCMADPGKLRWAGHFGLKEELREAESRLRQQDPAVLPLVPGPALRVEAAARGALAASRAASGAPALSSALRRAVQELPLEGPEGQPLELVSCRPLEPWRRGGLAGEFPQLAEGGGRAAVALVARDPSGGATRELVAVAEDEEVPRPELVMGACQITFEDLSPSECVEYAFGEDPGRWRAAQVSVEALEAYRGMKFKQWLDMLLHGTCEAQLRRMLQIGVVTRLFDDNIFPTPDELLHTYQVMDEHSGRTIKLPHPVSALRVWDPVKMGYAPIDPQLAGVPPEEEKEAWWEGQVQELREQMGAEYIDSLLGGASHIRGGHQV